MKNIYLLLLSIAFTASGFSQDFIYTPSEHVADTIMEGAGSSLDIYIENTDSNDITYGWITVSNDIPESWFTTLCDWPNCFAGIPDSGTMNTITAAAQDSIQGFFKLTLSAGSAPDRSLEKRTFFQDLPPSRVLNNPLSELSLKRSPMTATKAMFGSLG